jgi:hypothetical protein
VPAWLRDLCGRTYNTSGIREIFNRLHQDLLDSTNPVFPDIEILPHITLDDDEPRSPIRYTKRKSPTTHQRAHSMGVGLSQSPDSFSGATPGSTFEHLESATLHKRKRGNDSLEVEPGLIAQNQRLRLDVATGIPRHELPHRSLLHDSHRVCETVHQHGGIDPYQTPTITSTSSTQPHDHLSHTTGSTPTSLHAPDPSHRRSRSAVSSFTQPEASRSTQYHAQDATAAAVLYHPREARAAPAPARRSNPGHARHQSSPVGKGREEGGMVMRGARREVRKVVEERR